VKFARRHRLRIRLLEKLPRQRAILQKFLERATKRWTAGGHLKKGKFTYV
jgi:hypothetical protein